MEVSYKETSIFLCPALSDFAETDIFPVQTLPETNSSEVDFFAMERMEAAARFFAERGCRGGPRRVSGGFGSFGFGCRQPAASFQQVRERSASCRRKRGPAHGRPRVAPGLRTPRKNIIFVCGIVRPALRRTFGSASAEAPNGASGAGRGAGNGRHGG